MYTANYLSGVKKKALRKGIWYSAIDTLERSIVNITIRIVSKVESEVLGIELLKILKKLKSAKKNVINEMIAIGYKKAKKLIDHANRWGNDSASFWVSDWSFIKYITIMEFVNRTSGVVL